MNASLSTDSATDAEQPTLGRPPKQQDQRQRILQAAAKSIATVGFERCSLADIASELDLTRPALYHYFGTKQAIFSEIAMTVVAGMFEHVNAVVNDRLSETQQLEALMLAHADYYDRHYWMMNATITGYGGTTRREIENLEEFESYRSRYEKILHRVLRRGMDNGEFRKVNVRAMARSIYQLLNITRWYRPGGKKCAVDFARESFDLITAGLLKK